LPDIGLGDVRELAIRDFYAADRRIGVASQVERVFALLTRDVLHHYVAHYRLERSALAFFVEEVDIDHRLRHLADRRVREVDIFNDTATMRVRFDAKRAIQMRAVHPVVVDEDVADAAGNFAADGN